MHRGDMDIDRQADKAMLTLLTNNLKVLYHAGYNDGVRAIMLATAHSLSAASNDDGCPENLKDGLVEAANYLKSTADGVPYRLVKKEKDNNNLDI